MYAIRSYYAVHIRINIDHFSMKRRTQRRCRSVASTASQCRKVADLILPLEPGYNHYVFLLQLLQHSGRNNIENSGIAIMAIRSETSLRPRQYGRRDIFSFQQAA